MQTTVATPVVKTTVRRRNVILRALDAYTRLFNKISGVNLSNAQMLHWHHITLALVFTLSSTSVLTLLMSLSWLIAAGLWAKKGGAL